MNPGHRLPNIPQRLKPINPIADNCRDEAGETKRLRSEATPFPGAAAEALNPKP